MAVSTTNSSDHASFDKANYEMQIYWLYILLPVILFAPIVNSPPPMANSPAPTAYDNSSFYLWTNHVDLPVGLALGQAYIVYARSEYDQVIRELTTAVTSLSTADRHAD